MLLKCIRVLDYLIFGIILCIVLWSTVFLYGKNSHKKIVIIESPKGKWTYPVDIQKTVQIPGALGFTEVRIEDNTAYIISSPCPNKTCALAPRLVQNGDWNACLPNRVFIRIEGGDEETAGVDDPIDMRGY